MMSLYFDKDPVTGNCLHIVAVSCGASKSIRPPASLTDRLSVSPLVHQSASPTPTPTTNGETQVEVGPDCLHKTKILRFEH